MKRLRLFWFIIKRCSADKIVYAFISNILIVSAIITWIEPSITTYGEGIWYTLISCTTIGFGDLVATTVIGRILTIYMAFSGMFLISIVAGVVVSYYIEVIGKREKESITVFLDKLEHLPELSKEELENISQKVRSLR